MSRTFWTRAALFLGALVFLFPFYYMVVGSFQKSPDTTVKGVVPARAAGPSTTTRTSTTAWTWPSRCSTR